jgi:hypothetical protein
MNNQPISIADRRPASAEEPGTPDVPAAPAIRGGVVSRCALFARLAKAERVVQMSAPAGSGKTVLMRSWIAEAGTHLRRIYSKLGLFRGW